MLNYTMSCTHVAAYENSKRCNWPNCVQCVVTERVSSNESDLAADTAVPGRSQRGERKRRGLTLQGWWPRIEAVRWGSIDQQGGSRISWWRARTRPTSEGCTQCRTHCRYSTDRLWHFRKEGRLLHANTLLKSQTDANYKLEIIFFSGSFSLFVCLSAGWGEAYHFVKMFLGL